jgi:hypothetical protein
MNKFIDAIENVTYTENNALTLASSGSKIVDWFFHGAAMRKEAMSSCTNERIINMFVKAFEADPTTALRILFYIRDCRGGQGERQVFRNVLYWLADNQHEWLRDNLALIPEYGRWDDLFVLFHTKVHESVFTFIRNRINNDLVNLRYSRPVSLLAKWMPSENTSSKDTRKDALMLIKEFGITPRSYRKMLSQLRKHIDIVESHLSQKTYEGITYQNVPSKASMIYKNAFSKHDNSRYAKYLAKVEDGKLKINTSVLYPYELIERISRREDKTIELMWKNLPDYVPNICGLVVADTSGSMAGRPMSISISLAMYIAERNKNEAWKDVFISFSGKPKFHRITGKNLYERYKSVKLGNVANTNIQAVFDLILERANREGVSKEDMPKFILIISDMEFDQACTNNSKTNFEEIKDKYAKYNYPMPSLIFWNVNSRNNQSPVKFDETGTVLLSGCSPTVFKYALGTAKSPIDTVYNVTNSDRYKNIIY